MPIPISTTAPVAKSQSAHHSSIDLDWTDFDDLAARYGTPFYHYDLEKISVRYRELCSFFPAAANPSLLYSFKANPLPSVAGELQSCGAKADLTSPGEVAAAIEAGFDLSEALYGGPGKSISEYIHALEAGIRHFSVESAHDLKAISEATDETGGDAKVLIRINPAEPPRAKLAMSGVASQFGFEEEDLRSEGPRAIRSCGKRVSIVGIHIYWGTQIGNAEALLACFEKSVSISNEISELLGFPLEILNLGGGFPWPYSHIGGGEDLTDLKKGLEKIHAEAGAAAKAKWWFESGRFLVASSGSLVTRVMDLKKSKDGKQFLILDTGIHHLGGMSGLGRIPRFSIDLVVPEERKQAEEITVDVVGQLCTPLDCIGKKIRIPRPEIGDLLIVPNTGAYGPTASVLGFLSRPAPAEIACRGNKIISVHQLSTGHRREL